MNENRFSTVLLFLAVACVGFLLVPRLGFNFGASHRAPIITVTYTYPQAPPEEIERTLTTPLEAGLALIEGIESTRSEIRTGQGFTRIYLQKAMSLDFVRFQIAQMLRQLYISFPEGTGYPRISVNDPDEKEIDPTILSYSLNGPSGSFELYRYARDQLVPSFSDVSGLQRVEVEGGSVQEYRIEYGPDLLLVTGLRPDEVGQLMVQYLDRTGFSNVQLKGQSMYATLQQRYLDDLLKLQIPLPEGGSVPMSQFVSVKQVEERKNRYYRINGMESIRLNFIPEDGSNHMDLSLTIRKRADQLISQLPVGFDLYLEYDQTEYIRDELKKIRDRTIWSVSFLLLFVFISYRSIKGALIPLLAAVVNLGIAIILYNWFDVQMNLYALAGITVSFGIILDNIIVMAHHIRRHQNRRVMPALVTATLTTLTALVVIFILPDSLKFELIDFAKVLTINLGVSLVVAYLFIPALISNNPSTRPFSKRSARRGHVMIRMNLAYKTIVLGLRRYRKSVLTAVILLFGLPVFWLPNQKDGWDLYNKTLGTDYYVENIKPIVNRVFGGTLRLFSRYVYDTSGIRSIEETALYMAASLPMGSTIEQMNALIQQLEGYLYGYSTQLKTYLTVIQNGEYAQIRIFFPSNGDPTFPYILKSRLESFAVNLGGVSWNIYGVGRGFSNASANHSPQFKVLLKGYNRDYLDHYAEELGNMLLEHPRIAVVNKNANMNWWEKSRFEYVLNVDKEALAHQRVDQQALYQILEMHNQSPKLLSFTPKNEAIRMVDKSVSFKDLWSLNHTQHVVDSMRLSFASVASLSKQAVANSIHKEDQQYMQMLEFKYTGSTRFGQGYLDQCLDALRLTLPLGYSADQDNANYWGSEAQKQYGMLLLLIIAIFFICSIHFESIKTALAIITLIPISFIGIFITFYLFDLPFDQGGYTSFLLLSGIVVNSLIIVFSDYHRLRRFWPGRTRIDLYLRAFRQKITPVYLTIASTVLGLIPFMLHGTSEVFWFALAAGTIGGLLFSIFVIVFVVPLLVK